MVIDWTEAPEGATHGMTVGRGEVRWYRVGDNVECWSVTIGWTQSFFLTKEEFNDAGLHLYEYGEQSELVMLREQRDALLAILVELVDIEGPQPGTAAWADRAMALIDKCGGRANG